MPTIVNREICKQLIKKGKWQDTLCLLCSVRKRSKCENLKTIREKEDHEYEETVLRFDERRDEHRGAEDEVSMRASQ